MLPTELGSVASLLCALVFSAVSAPCGGGGELFLWHLERCGLQPQQVSKEAEDIVKIIGQVATYTRPANLGRRPGTCAICQDPEAFKRSGRAAMGKCGTPRAKHVFCGACFTAWFIQAGESSCPMCRHDYSKDFRDL